MAKILGINAVAYIGATGSVNMIPQRNEWSLSIQRELQEARVFQAAGAGASWVDQTAGFRSWSGSMNGYYDDDPSTGAPGKLVSYSIGANSTASAPLWLYEDRAKNTNYWYGNAWFEISETVNVDGFVELNCDFTGDGVLSRFAA